MFCWAGGHWIRRRSTWPLTWPSRVFSPLRFRPARRQSPARHSRRSVSTFGQVARARSGLFVTATNVRTGRGRVFRNAEITPEVLLASACLPTVFQAIEIEGERPTGMAATPAIRQLPRSSASANRKTRSLSRLIPLNAQGRPVLRATSSDRLNEVSFNSALLEGVANDRAVAESRGSGKQ